jgi:hypothetical protein
MLFLLLNLSFYYSDPQGAESRFLFTLTPDTGKDVKKLSEGARGNAECYSHSEKALSGS